MLHLCFPRSDERPSDEPLYLAKLQFRNGNYGLAEEYHRRAVEANPESLNAWLGLAHSGLKLSSPGELQQYHSVYLFLL